MVYDEILLSLRHYIGAIGVVVIVLGALRSVYQLCMMVIGQHFTSNYIRLQFGDSVILGLEFMVGGDIVATLVQPDYYNLGLLAILVVIRTILSYFLNQELEALTPKQRQALK